MSNAHHTHPNTSTKAAATLGTDGETDPHARRQFT